MSRDKMRLHLLKVLKESFGLKVFATFTLLIFIISFSFTFFFIGYQRDYLRDTLIKKGKLLAEILAYNSRLGVFSENKEMLKIPVEGIFQQEGVLEVSVFNLEGKLLTKVERSETGLPKTSVKEDAATRHRIFEILMKSSSFYYLEDNSKAEFWSPVITSSRYSAEDASLSLEKDLSGRQERIIGFVAITVDKGMLKKQLHNLLFKSILIGIAFLVIGSYFIYLITKGVTRPLNRLTQGVKTLEKGGIVKEVHIETKDEIGRLARAFNDMSKSLSKRERELRESEKKYRTILDSIEEAYFEVDLRGNFIFFNDSLSKILGYSKDELIGMNHRDYMPPETGKEIFKVFNQIYRTGKPRRKHTYEVIKKDGSHGFHGLVASLMQDKDGQPIGFRGIAHDITERKRAEEKITASLKEKELLLQEIHHRVKNNMQVISSLLKLQAATIKDETLRAPFRDSEHRVRAMSLVHEKLYQSKDLTHVPFKDYLQSLIRYLYQSYTPQAETIELTSEIEELPLTITHAIPCGLIVNELVSNALKHAFPGERKGTITLSLRSPEPHTYELTVSDDGIGLPETIDLHTTKSLGLHLVSILVEDQLKGEIEVERTGGTRFRITFKVR